MLFDCPQHDLSKVLKLSATFIQRRCLLTLHWMLHADKLTTPGPLKLRCFPIYTIISPIGHPHCPNMSISKRKVHAECSKLLLYHDFPLLACGLRLARSAKALLDETQCCPHWQSVVGRPKPPPESGVPCSTSLACVHPGIEE